MSKMPKPIFAEVHFGESEAWPDAYAWRFLGGIFPREQVFGRVFSGQRLECPKVCTLPRSSSLLKMAYPVAVCCKREPSCAIQPLKQERSSL